MKLPSYEVHEGDADGVKKICTCGSEYDARLMMMYAPPGKQRSWIRIEYDAVQNA